MSQTAGPESFHLSTDSSPEEQRPGFTLAGEQFASLAGFAAAVRFPPGSDARAALASTEQREARELAESFGSSSLVYWNGETFPLTDKRYGDLMRAAVAAEKEARGIAPNPDHLIANVVASSKQYGLCSNLAHTPFEIDGRKFESVEALVQFIKYPPGDARAAEIPSLHGTTAKSAGREINAEIKATLDAGGKANFYWNGEKFDYQDQAEIRYDIIKRALLAKFEANPEAVEQLLSSGDKQIVHRLGIGGRETAYTALPATVFCELLSEVREHLRGPKPPH